MGEVEEPGGVAHRVVFLHQAGVLDGHLPAGEGDHPGAEGAVTGIEGGLLHGAIRVEVRGKDITTRYFSGAATACPATNRHHGASNPSAMLPCRKPPEHPIVNAHRAPSLLLLLAACGGGTAKTALNVPTIDTLAGGVIHVKNTGPTAWADTNGWRWVSVATINPAEGSSW